MKNPKMKFFTITQQEETKEQTIKIQEKMWVNKLSTKSILRKMKSKTAGVRKKKQAH